MGKKDEPSEPKDVASVNPDYMRGVSHVDQTQMLMEIQRSLGLLEGKVESLVKDVEKNEGRSEKASKDLGEKIDNLTTVMNRFFGGIAAAGMIFAALWAIATFAMPYLSRNAGNEAPAQTLSDQADQNAEKEN